MAETDQVTDTWPGFPDRFADIVEVRPTSFKRANLFIAAGYRLLGIHSISRAGKLPNDDILIKGLSSVHYEYTSDGKLKIEAKADTKALMTDDAAKKQGAMDAADAFVLTFASDVATMILGSGIRKTEPFRRGSSWII